MSTNKNLSWGTIFLVFLLLVTLIPVNIQAQSLWVDNQQSRTSGYFSDRSAHKVGDIITIIISESTTASTSGNTSNSKNSSVNLDAGVGWLDFIKLTNAGYKDNFKAQGSSSNSNKVQGRVTVKVTEINAEGNLVVSGTQSIKQNKEEQKITITGLVRPEDVSKDNTVLSSNVADAEIKIDNKGPIGKKQRQGILTQILNFFF